MSRRAEAFSLFDEGKVPSSPEVKALKLKGSTRYTYYDAWKKEKDIPPGSTVTSAEGKPKGKVISELEMVVPSTEKETEGKEEGEG